MNRPTIADLAKAAGVSVSTVNRLLHGTGNCDRRRPTSS
ncbi:LacI family DNA-binding transcriptional regulator [Mesorhizobium neociceri]|nr:LacI family DNA-binding transcriptional regulator [Mesorhizobium neociceri]